MGIKWLIALVIFVLINPVNRIFAQGSIPQLQKVGDQYQLVVKGEPYLMLAGELGNSTASTWPGWSPFGPG